MTTESNYINLNEPLKKPLLQYISLGLSENIETSLYGQRKISYFIHMAWLMFVWLKKLPAKYFQFE
jgi:hypothetical protein